MVHCRPDTSGVQRLADARQRDVDDGAVDEGQAGAEHRGRSTQRARGSPNASRAGVSAVTRRVGHDAEANLPRRGRGGGLLRHSAAAQARHRAGQPGPARRRTAGVRARPAAGRRRAPAGRPIAVRRGAGLCAGPAGAGRPVRPGQPAAHDGRRSLGRLAEEGQRGAHRPGRERGARVRAGHRDGRQQGLRHRRDLVRRCGSSCGCATADGSELPDLPRGRAADLAP